MEAEAGALASQGAGTEDAQAEFSRLVEAHWRSAYRFAYRLTGNPEEAADLVQEAAEEAFRAFSRFRPGTRFDRWWLRILYNSFVDRTRRQRRQSYVPLDDLSGDMRVTASWADPEAALEQQLDGPVQRALDALPPEFRAVVVLVDLEGLSYEDAARVLRCPPGTVRSRLHRGRLALREWLRGYVDALRRGELG
ncbi:MAG: sigma-70 family RNA polymerase sigma factor [Armatimonadota bacterium]|nr:sigma-70 family RNA polymerase sigma factor [Armatimonadota bacterium]MDR7432758.1 sigma-70 family RNA polymerase sigma factor [Armatimonadota bacterium]MDR7447106.1 sigma-70 family RNA polymerase sigma factor [Armatimonadota bacterium]MDR7566208.1 sigma-70 family RNA polymerase sigma factor [Armatimonadota bacterium]MDR7581745.1 sigma-70 family RNA polymerase sigma factor [Armatimonadota bacterium]